MHAIANPRHCGRPRCLWVRTVLAALVIGSFLAPPSQAQISFGGRPIGLSGRFDIASEYPVVELPEVDGEALIREDADRESSGVKGPYRFGFNHAVDLGMTTHGTWSALPHGDRVWRLGIHCPAAYSINFVFDVYRIPEGASVFVYNDQGDRLGAFTAASNGGRSSMGVAQLPGERITIEYFEPAGQAGQGDLHVDRVTHGYRDIFAMARDLGESGDCNINVICPEGDDWRDQIRSVAIITTGGSGFCTGTLVNNCAEDGTPYFLTANHCLDADVENWVFRFNWDSPVCEPTENGPVDQTVSGCTLLASSAGTDMAFLELNTAPPEEYNVYYSGWDHTDTPAQTMTGIHHPSGDIKKISRSFGAAVPSIFDGADCWRVTVWDEGTTEPGSSGSGLWNQNKQLVGQLFGGAAECGNSVDDHYGRLDLSWPLIEQWLGNTCGDTLGGWEPDEIVPIVFDAAVTSINNVATLLCGEDSITPRITLKNNGSVLLTQVEISYGMIGGPSYLDPWTGSLQPGQTVNINLAPIPLLPGENVLTVSSSAPNGSVDQVLENDAWTFAFTASVPAATLNLILTLDEFGSDVTWELTSETGTVLYSAGPYADGVNGFVDSVAFCLTNGCYTFTILDVFGNGICCDDGEGEYVIRDLNGTVYAQSDGQYQDVNMNEFCLSEVAVRELSRSGQLRVYPNPSAGMFQVDLSSLNEARRFVVHDAVGRVLQEGNLGALQPAMTVDLGEPPAGIYLLSILHRDGVAVRRVIVRR